MTKDYMKSKVMHDYTAWDLNCPQFVHIKNRQQIEKMFKRKARRIDKQSLKKFINA